MLADIQRTVYPDEVTRQLHVMAQARESSLVIGLRFNCVLHHQPNTGVHCKLPQQTGGRIPAEIELGAF